MSVRVQIVSSEPPLIAVDNDNPRGKALWLTKDEAVHLANRLTDAVDELELAQGVSGS